MTYRMIAFVWLRWAPVCGVRDHLQGGAGRLRLGVLSSAINMASAASFSTSASSRTPVTRNMTKAWVDALVAAGDVSEEYVEQQKKLMGK